MYDKPCNVEKIADTCDQDDAGKYPSGRTHLVHLHKSCSSHGYGSHVYSIKKIPFFNYHISGHTDEKKNPGKDKGPDDLLKSVHKGINTDLKDENQGKIIGYKSSEAS